MSVALLRGRAARLSRPTSRWVTRRRNWQREQRGTSCEQAATWAGGAVRGSAAPPALAEEGLEALPRHGTAAKPPPPVCIDRGWKGVGALQGQAEDDQTRGLRRRTPAQASPSCARGGAFCTGTRQPGGRRTCAA